MANDDKDIQEIYREPNGQDCSYFSTCAIDMKREKDQHSSHIQQ